MRAAAIQLARTLARRGCCSADCRSGGAVSGGVVKRSRGGHDSSTLYIHRHATAGLPSSGHCTTPHSEFRDAFPRSSVRLVFLIALRFGLCTRATERHVVTLELDVP